MFPSTLRETRPPKIVYPVGAAKYACCVQVPWTFVNINAKLANKVPILGAPTARVDPSAEKLMLKPKSSIVSPGMVPTSLATKTGAAKVLISKI